MALIELADGSEALFDEYGDRESPPVVLLHDAASDPRTWGAVARELSRDYNVVTPALPGHGGAPENPAAASLHGAAAWLLALLDAVGIEMAVLGGSGYGGRVALEAVLAAPARAAGLVLAGAAVFAGARGDPAALEAAHVARTFGGRMLSRRAALAVSDPFLAEGMRAVHAGGAADAIGAALEELLAHGRDAAPVAALEAPLLICAGESEPGMQRWREVTGAIPRARVLTFRDTAHSPAVARAFPEVLARFLRDVEDGNPIAGRRSV